MIHDAKKNSLKKEYPKEKILLGVLPYWTPLIPPIGISCIKSYLQGHGYDVKLFDLNVEVEFKIIYDDYFAILQEDVPLNKRGNFFNIGIDLLQNHMTAYLHHTNRTEYLALLENLISANFFYKPRKSQIDQLDKVISRFFSRLETRMMHLLEKEKPDVLGLSMFKGNLASTLFAFKLTRDTFPHITTVLGGGIFSDQLALDSPNLEFFLKKTPYIDKIIIGEGENLFLKLLQGELPASQRVYSVKTNHGGLLDLSKIDIPDFSGLKLEYYPLLCSFTSRSCPFQCGFCAETIFWGKYRRKQATQVVKELTRLSQTYGSQLFLLTDSLLNPIVTPLANELLKSDRIIYWDGYLRVDKKVCNIENPLLWRRGGFYRARLGIESGSQRILDLMEKRIKISQVKLALSNLARCGIKTTTYWVIGYPGETEADFQHSLNLIEELKDDIYEAECNPFRFYLKGQVNSENWIKENQYVPLYPEDAREMLILQTWMLADSHPSREVIYNRMNRFIQHCTTLGVPNPYSLSDIYKADRRWEQLHHNSVPPLVKFKNKNEYIDECRNITNNPEDQLADNEQKQILKFNELRGAQEYEFE